MGVVIIQENTLKADFNISNEMLDIFKNLNEKLKLVQKYVNRQVVEFDVEVNKYNNIISSIMRPQILELTNQNTDLKCQIIQINKQMDELKHSVQSGKSEN